MKKITLALSTMIAAFGLMQAQEGQLPAAYYTGSTTPVAETTGVAQEGSILINPDNLFIPSTGINGPHARNMAPDLVYDNGTYINEPGPPELSIVENMSMGMSTYGFGVQVSAQNSIADDFTLDDDYDITSIDTYVYQTGEGSPSISGVYIQIYDGDPSAGGSVIWGDLTQTNLMLDNDFTGVYRVLEDAQNDTSRMVQLVTAETTGLSLTAGTYWVEVTFEGMGASGPWAPPISILGQPETGDAMQFTGSSGAWQALVDTGSGAPQGLPFQLYGTPALSINDHVLDGFKFYPNPTNNIINLSANKNIESVALYNLLGQEVMTSTIGATSSEISLSGLSAGTYIMRISVDGQTGTFKVMKN